MFAAALLRRGARRALGQRRWLALPSHQVVGLPALSPTMEGGTIATWKVAEGGSFAAGDVIAEIETDKATVDFEAQDDGVVAKILVEAGNETKVGDPIVVFVDDAADVPAFKDFKPDGAAPPPTAPPPTAPPPTAPPATAPPPTAPPAPPPPTAAPPSVGGRVIASPYARKMAKERGLDLALVAGTGPGGRIVADDVAAYKEAPPTPAAAVPTVPTTPAPPSSGALDFALTPTSAAIAARLAYSMQTAPHYYLTVELAVGPALELLEKLNAGLEDDAQVCLTDLFIKASASATKAVPAVNSSWLDGGVIRQYQRFDVNFVVGVNEGLAAPVVRDVERLGLKDIADFTKKAVAGVEEPYASGTFTICNLGAFGVASAAPVVHAPQACSLALGTVEDKLVPSSDPETPYAVQPTLVATLSADHRVVDGAVGAQWLQALKGLIEAPHNILL